MSTLEYIFHKENYSNHEYRKEATEIIENSKNPTADLENLAKKEGTPSSYINTAIPLIHALQKNTLNKKDIPSAKEYLDVVDHFLYIYPISETEVCIPFYFDTSELYVNKYLWPNGWLEDPMYFFLPKMEIFKERLDEHFNRHHNKFGRYKFLVDLRKKASNSISYLESRIEELKTFHPFLKQYSSVVKSAKSKAQDIHYVTEGYLTPLASTPIPELKGNLKDTLPTWEYSWDQLELLYNELNGKFIASETQKESFFNLFKGKSISTFQSRIIWTDINPYNKVPTSSTILKLFRVLAYNDCIDRRYGANGGLVRDIAHHCFLVDEKPPNKNSMNTAWSNMDGTSKKYKELESIVQSIKSSTSK